MTDTCYYNYIEYGAIQTINTSNAFTVYNSGTLSTGDTLALGTSESNIIADNYVVVALSNLGLAYLVYVSPGTLDVDTMIGLFVYLKVQATPTPTPMDSSSLTQYYVYGTATSTGTTAFYYPLYASQEDALIASAGAAVSSMQFSQDNSFIMYMTIGANIVTELSQLPVDFFTQHTQKHVQPAYYIFGTLAPVSARGYYFPIYADEAYAKSVTGVAASLTFNEQSGTTYYMPASPPEEGLGVSLLQLPNGFFDRYIYQNIHTPYYVYGVDRDAPVGEGYYFPLYLDPQIANAHTGTAHPHVFVENTALTFHMPSNYANYATPFASLPIAFFYNHTQYDIKEVFRSEYVPSLDSSEYLKVVVEPEANGSISASTVRAALNSLPQSDKQLLHLWYPAYVAASDMSIRGGAFREIGFYVEHTRQASSTGHAEFGALTFLRTDTLGAIYQSASPHNITQISSIVISDREVRVVRSIELTTKSIVLDKAFSNPPTNWYFIRSSDASEQSDYRLMNSIAVQSAGGGAFTSTTAHRLVVGDYFIGQDANSNWHSLPVSHVLTSTQFVVTSPQALLAFPQQALRSIFMFATETETSSFMTFHRMLTRDGHCVDFANTVDSKIYIRNHNIFGKHGTYYDSSISANGPSVQFTTLHYNLEWSPDVDASTVMRLKVNKSPSPQQIALSNYVVSGGEAGETGKRPIVSVVAKSSSDPDQTVYFWGYYARYFIDSPDQYLSAHSL